MLAIKKSSPIKLFVIGGLILALLAIAAAGATAFAAYMHANPMTSTTYKSWTQNPNAKVEQVTAPPKPTVSPSPSKKASPSPSGSPVLNKSPSRSSSPSPSVSPSTTPSSTPTITPSPEPTPSDPPESGQ